MKREVEREREKEVDEKEFYNVIRIGCFLKSSVFKKDVCFLLWNFFRGMEDSPFIVKRIDTFDDYDFVSVYRLL